MLCVLTAPEQTWRASHGRSFDAFPRRFWAHACSRSPDLEQAPDPRPDLGSSWRSTCPPGPELADSKEVRILAQLHALVSACRVSVHHYTCLTYFSFAELASLVEMHLPRGGNEWDRVTEAFNEWALANNQPIRDRKSLTKKFDELANATKPTGDPNCPAYVSPRAVFVHLCCGALAKSSGMSDMQLARIILERNGRDPNFFDQMKEDLSVLRRNGTTNIPLYLFIFSLYPLCVSACFVCVFVLLLRQVRQAKRAQAKINRDVHLGSLGYREEAGPISDRAGEEGEEEEEEEEQNEPARAPLPACLRAGPAAGLPVPPAALS